MRRIKLGGGILDDSMHPASYLSYLSLMHEWLRSPPPNTVTFPDEVELESYYMGALFLLTIAILSL
jgi:hypothetical protein